MSFLVLIFLDSHCEVNEGFESPCTLMCFQVLIFLDSHCEVNEGFESPCTLMCFQVLIFLDSHCEVNEGWLEPLLSHIKIDRRNVAIPIIDIINADFFALEASPLVRGGFNWGLFYRWDPVPQSLLHDDDSLISPIK